MTSPSDSTPSFATAAVTYNYGQLRAGSYNSCVYRTQSGVVEPYTVLCWGNNHAGAVGTGTTGGSILRPRVIANNTGAQAWVGDIGLRHQCALYTSSTGTRAYCWGYNANGQLGDGTTTSRNVPTLVRGGITNWHRISTGYNHTCAVTTAGVAYCWGNGSWGALGNGSTVGSLVPIGVHTNIAFSNVHAGESFTCGRAQGTPAAIYCWGQNVYGQLGIGNTTTQMTPGPAVVGGAKWIDYVTAGGHHVCALSYIPAQTYCWGANTYGQLGIGNTTQQNSPVVVNIQAQPIAAGGEFTCGRQLSDARMYCWGRGSLGALGNGFFGNRLTPYPVSGGLAYQNASGALAAGANHVLARRTDGVVMAWGHNSYGQVGDGTTDTKPSPVVVQFPP